MTRKCDLLNVGPMSGNKVSHSNRKSKRRFLPNLCELSFRSDTLGVDVNLRVSASTLRTVNKFGNIDNFLVNYRFNKMSDLAKKLRTKIKKKLISQNKLQEIEINNSKKAKKANKA
jgi:large subunit ribosomal protein L28